MIKAYFSTHFSTMNNLKKKTVEYRLRAENEVLIVKICYYLIFHPGHKVVYNEFRKPVIMKI